MAEWLTAAAPHAQLCHASPDEQVCGCAGPIGLMVIQALQMGIGQIFALIKI